MVGRLHYGSLISPDGKILWVRNSFVDQDLCPYRTARPIMVYVGCCRPSSQKVEVKAPSGAPCVQFKVNAAYALVIGRSVVTVKRDSSFAPRIAYPKSAPISRCSDHPDCAPVLADEMLREKRPWTRIQVKHQQARAGVLLAANGLKVSVLAPAQDRPGRRNRDGPSSEAVSQRIRGFATRGAGHRNSGEMAVSGTIQHRRQQPNANWHERVLTKQIPSQGRYFEIILRRQGVPFLCVYGVFLRVSARPDAP